MAANEREIHSFVTRVASHAGSGSLGSARNPEGHLPLRYFASARCDRQSVGSGFSAVLIFVIMGILRGR